MDSFGSSGGCGHSGGESLCGGRGGGRIRITIEGDTNIGTKSQIVADGASAPKGSTNLTCCGAGAGGTIILRSVSLAGSGPIGASGGDGNVKGTLVRGGGGGGRIILAIGKNNYGGKIAAFGGSTGGSSANIEPQEANATMESSLRPKRLPTSQTQRQSLPQAATRAATGPSTTLAIKACFPSIPRCSKSVDRRRAQ